MQIRIEALNTLTDLCEVKGLGLEPYVCTLYDAAASILQITVFFVDKEGISCQ